VPERNIAERNAGAGDVPAFRGLPASVTKESIADRGTGVRAALPRHALSLTREA